MNNNKPGLFYGYIILAITFVIFLITFGTANSFGVFLEPMLKEINWTRSSISGAFSLAQIVGGIMGIVGGKIADRFGPRLIITISIVFLGAGYLLMPLVHSIWQMYLFYGLLTGIGIGGLNPPLFATVSRWFNKRRTLMMGVFTCGGIVGTIVISQLTRWLIDIRDWQFAFLVVGIVSLVVVGISAQFMKRDPQSIGQLPDGDTQPVVNPQLNAGLPTRGLSVTEAMRTGKFWLFFIANVFISIILFTVSTHLVIYTTGLNISYAFAVSLLTIISIPNIISRLVMGNVADRIGNKLTIIIGTCLMCLACVWLIFAREAWMLVIFAVIFGFAWGTCTVPMAPLIAELFGLKSLGTMLGIANMSVMIGSAVGPVLAGFIFDVRNSYQIDFILLAICAAAALVTMLLLKTKPLAIQIPGKSKY
ncbi:MAG: MFS transporter [Dehalococcoidales bacterium]|nr:MFS transporter [Dehalococcoidales bacterium]